MAQVVFFEKPGCINNTRQKKLLSGAGHEVVEHNLLQHEWTKLELRAFFGSLPVQQWFNPSAPAIKQGDVNPALVDEQKALELMLNDPLLIRRPLMQVGDEVMVGFDPDAVNRWIGLAEKVESDIESCPRN